MIKNELREKIIKNSISLEKYGIHNLAWSKVDAQQLIHLIDKDKIGIFGGDVYKLTSTLESLSDNWSCEPTESESEDEFNARSKQESLKYIKNYPVEKGEKILFSIIFTEQVC